MGNRKKKACPCDVPVTTSNVPCNISSLLRSTSPTTYTSRISCGSSEVPEPMTREVPPEPCRMKIASV